MSFYFAKMNARTNQSEQRCIVHITIDRDLKIIKFDVDLDSLPSIELDGWEVITKFKIRNFDNNQTFFTDSNGLEMQERILNYRPTWDIQKNYDDMNLNISYNYYPVNSAVSMQDVNSDRAFTVMNDRPQGASALSSGAIEFMQNRRIPADDGKGVEEILDERDQYGNPIRVPASYYVAVNNAFKNQRLVQQRSDNPAQYFFNFALKQVKNGTTNDLP